MTDLATRARGFFDARRKNNAIGILQRNFFCGENVTETLDVQRFTQAAQEKAQSQLGAVLHLTYVFVVVSRHYIAISRFLYCNRKSDRGMVNACRVSVEQNPFVMALTVLNEQ
ncbi:MAG: hypothetical protein AAF417_03005 [Pseudomonadota bacterium]